MNDLLQDLAFAWRNAMKKPGTALLIVLTLALGIGANTAMFSMTWHVVMAPLPYKDGGQLVRVVQHAPKADLDNTPWSVPTFMDYREQNTVFSDIVEYHRMTFTLLGHGDPHLVTTGVVSWQYFDFLGIKPLLGRGFVSTDEVIGAEASILLTYEFWQEKFGGDPDIVGTALEMNNAVHTVIGVLPKILPFPHDNDIWITTTSCPFRASDQFINGRQVPIINGVFGKLHDHASMEAASRDVATIGQRLEAAYPDDYPQNRGHAATLGNLKEEMVGDSSTTFVLLLSLAFLVVLIASANVANLNLARLATRSQELAIREAVGAQPSRIARQLLTESMLFALVGGVLGLLIAYPGLGLLSRFAQRYTPLAAEIQMDGSMLLFSLGIALFTGLLSGSAAAFTRRDINKSLKEGGDKVTASTSGKRKREVLLAVQFALSFVILTASALIVLSLYRLNNEDPGYDPSQVLVTGMSLNFTNYTTPQQTRDFGTRLLQEVRAISGVELAGISAETPLDGAVLGPVPFDIEGRTLADAALRPTAKPTVISEDYLDVMNISLQKGRAFTADDDQDALPVILINRSFEARFFPEGSSLGQRISTNNGQSWNTIIGVVENIRSVDLNQEEGDTIYTTFRQTPNGNIDLFVRSSGNLEQLGEQITHIVHGIDSQQAVDSVRTMEEVKSEWLQAPRLIASLIGLFGILALVVTLSGVIGVVSYNVSQRLREVGIHMAIGATPRHVVRMFLKQGMQIFATGLVGGVLLMAFIAPSLAALLYKTSSLNPVVYGVIAVVLTLVVLLAMFVPARRAGNLNPTAALRNE